MPMDSVISIGGQSFLDGLIRILGPALQPLRAPMPVALPGVSNAVLSIRNIQPVLLSDGSGQIQLNVELDLKGEVLLVASVAAGLVNFTLGNGTIDLNPSTGTIAEPARNGTLVTNPGTGTETGNVAGVPTTLILTLNGLTGSVQLPAATAPLNLGAITGTIQFPAGVGNLALPLPAVVPVAVDFTGAAPLLARILLTPNVNGVLPNGPEAAINAARGFGLNFSLGNPTVPPPSLPGTFATTLQGALTTAIAGVTGQLLQGLPPLTQPAVDVLGVATGITNTLPGVVQSTLTDAFTDLKTRTGRLIYPTPAASASCDVRALPTAGKARLVFNANESLVLQVGFHRTNILATDAFPAFAPTASIDTRVTLTNSYVRDLLVCLLEKFPHLALPPGPPALAEDPPRATWDPVTLNIGPLALRGTLTLLIDGKPDVSKVIKLTFDLRHDDFWWAIHLNFTLPIAFDLNQLASLTALRLSGPIVETTFDFGLALGITLTLAAAGAVVALIAVSFGPVAVLQPGFVAIGALIALVPHFVAWGIGSLLRNALQQVFGPVHLLESPAALPSGILDAFGTLIPTKLEIDDLVADCVLETPTSPWAVLPLSRGLGLRPVGPGLVPIPGSNTGTGGKAGWPRHRFGCLGDAGTRGIER